MLTGGSDAVEPGPSILGARRREGGSTKLFGVKPLGHPLGIELSNWKYSRLGFRFELVPKTMQILQLGNCHVYPFLGD